MKQAVDGVLKHGMPSKENIKYRDGHCLAYDRATRNPRWVSRACRPLPLSDEFQQGSFLQQYSTVLWHLHDAPSLSLL